MMILYHYCSNTDFHSIIENRRILLSSLSLSNDSMEGKLVAEILARIAKADGLDQPATRRLQESVSRLEQLFDGLGFCLSEDGDLLSQWRGYAADATGGPRPESGWKLGSGATCIRSPIRPAFLADLTLL